ncbi:hypothetical protein QZH41_011830, partial [Actinostola sp. cb2023]
MSGKPTAISFGLPVAKKRGDSRGGGKRRSGGKNGEGSSSQTLLFPSVNTGYPFTRLRLALLNHCSSSDALYVVTMQSLIKTEIETFYRTTKPVEPVTTNPFKHRLHLTWSKKIELLFGFFFLFPLRLPLFILVFISVVFWSMVITYGTNCHDYKTPLPTWKRKLKKILQLHSRMLLYISGFHKVKIKGKLATPSEAPIVVFAPHSSFMDAFVLSAIEMVPSGLSKIENFQSPVTASLLMAIESIGVRRECPKSRFQSLENVKYRTLTTRGQWPHLLICPEGTCTNRTSLIHFKAGAFIPGCPVQPVCVKYISKPDIYSWVYDGPSGIELFLLIMCQLFHEAELEIMPVRTPTQQEVDNPKLFADNVRTEMARCLDVPTSGHSFEDCILMSEASRLGLPDEVAIVEYQSLSKALGTNVDFMKEHLETFAVVDTDKDGVITLEDYVKYHDLPISAPLKLLFTAFDPQNYHQVTFRQYLVGIACIKKVASNEEVYSNALQVSMRPRWSYKMYTYSLK